MPVNLAAVIPSALAKVIVAERPYPTPPPNHVVVKVSAVSINPADGIVQNLDIFKMPYPSVLGCDLAGIITELGDGVADRKIGQRVIGSTSSPKLGADAGAFQHYVCLPALCTAPLPDSISYERGCILPLTLATAAEGLFGKDALALPLSFGVTPSPSKVILIWGSGSAVGICAVQLALNAGYEVFTTASPSNKAMVESTGAKYFDYRSEALFDDIQGALGDRKFSAIFSAVMGDTVTGPVERLAKLSDLDYVCGIFPTQSVDGVSWKYAQSLKVWETDVGPAVFHEFLPSALETGKFVPLPKVRLVGNGLEFIQDGLDQVSGEYMKSNEGARKLVVTF